MKNATVSVRVDQSIKQEAESILSSLGIPVSVVIDALYHQIIYTKSIPFSISLPSEPKPIEEYAQSELLTKIMHSYQQSINKEGRRFDDVFDELEQDLI
ncbi:MAG: type II toxin-antitoxin system RelB/DinJ family antitoxin [Solobacterium sp.]|nr:type II toxin-antitoxin system RelB/DinJ family antitoxin [Solobacterium sp.]